MAHVTCQSHHGRSRTYQLQKMLLKGSQWCPHRQLRSDTSAVQGAEMAPVTQRANRRRLEESQRSLWFLNRFRSDASVSERERRRSRADAAAAVSTAETTVCPSSERAGRCGCILGMHLKRSEKFHVTDVAADVAQCQWIRIRCGFNSRAIAGRGIPLGDDGYTAITARRNTSPCLSHR